MQRPVLCRSCLSQPCTASPGHVLERCILYRPPHLNQTFHVAPYGVACLDKEAALQQQPPFPLPCLTPFRAATWQPSSPSECASCMQMGNLQMSFRKCKVVDATMVQASRYNHLQVQACLPGLPPVGLSTLGGGHY